MQTTFEIIVGAMSRVLVFDDAIQFSPYCMITRVPCEHWNV